MFYARATPIYSPQPDPEVMGRTRCVDFKDSSRAMKTRPEGCRKIGVPSSYQSTLASVLMCIDHKSLQLWSRTLIRLAAVATPCFQLRSCKQLSGKAEHTLLSDTASSSQNRSAFQTGPTRRPEVSKGRVKAELCCCRSYKALPSALLADHSHSSFLLQKATLAMVVLSKCWFRLRIQLCQLLLLLLIITQNPASAAFVDKFDVCKQQFTDYGGLQNITMKELGWVYSEHTPELDADFDRSNYATLTYKGSRQLH